MNKVAQIANIQINFKYIKLVICSYVQNFGKMYFLSTTNSQYFK